VLSGELREVLRTTQPRFGCQVEVEVEVEQGR